MAWNYRVFLLREKGESWFEIREVYYHADGVTPRAWSKKADPVIGEDLRWTLAAMQRALNAPVLDKSGEPCGAYETVRAQVFATLKDDSG